ncbi:hypothetical protein ANOM_001198 [Aspergillus nomiae NRRL 13137]|uniref:DUF1917-domain-containing protein n=1 Tax=Aspergillus nomiae NRRL (strain ATCC 15546 / NRRL 13137 / CBS 260.88 / M93) TaxID=1509407 RepID=A0A0L1JF45_ASPN3|nr:uncharacterized protein ANOM_001198 [Aspergillus nomiae NRRL 13137]KNG89983.1 hypothetical protein ANOM_001198 [Aspergillus nomiae NRRL 13137]
MPRPKRQTRTTDMSILDSNEFFSDESSFYGSEDEKARLEYLAKTYDPGPYWETIHPTLYSTIQHDALAVSKKQPISENNPPAKPKPSQHPVHFEPETPTSTAAHNARKRNEPVHDFLARLPPSETEAADVGPWIYVDHPGAPQGEKDIAGLVGRGTEMLRAFEERKVAVEVEMEGASALARGRKLVPLRRGLEREIFALARETGVVSGKWMLFLGEEDVDRVWGVVVEETIEGRLGFAAKVATRDGRGKARLLAIYTRDFGDVDDVRRVLERLVELELVRREERPIYYKCDAYTYLEITSGNSYGLKASMFSSREVLERKV